MPSTATTGQVTLRFLAAPTDAGQGGSVSGGRILEWIDKAGFACAAGWSGRYCVTAYVGNIDFHRPVQVGDLVEVSAQLVLTGRSSMTIVVDVYDAVVEQVIKQLYKLTNVTKINDVTQEQTLIRELALI
ncbi:MAG TPA: hotdog domain-containing protein, partial [Dermatophilaceae bacterium]|nr:hotdog domain-containing protein [Dermatophilaceae bacterium]